MNFSRVCVYMCLQIVCIYIRMHCMFVNIYICRHMDVQGEEVNFNCMLYIYIYIHTYVCVYIYIYIHTHTDINIYTHTNTHTSCMYTHTHTHTHTSGLASISIQIFQTISFWCWRRRPSDLGLIDSSKFAQTQVCICMYA